MDTNRWSHRGPLAIIFWDFEKKNLARNLTIERSSSFKVTSWCHQPPEAWQCILHIQGIQPRGVLISVLLKPWWWRLWILGYLTATCGVLSPSSFYKRQDAPNWIPIGTQGPVHCLPCRLIYWWLCYYKWTDSFGDLLGKSDACGTQRFGMKMLGVSEA